VFVLDVVAHGRPRSKGSHVPQVTKGGKLRAAAVQEDDLSRWERTIRSAASLAWNAGRGDSPNWPGYPRAWTGPVVVMARFRLVRPQRLAETMDQEPALVVPDLDKITRALLDGLNGVAYADDKQVTALLATKGYASPLERPGVTARVVAVEDGDEFAGWTLGRIVEGWTGR
jgi:hypothetical protein